MKDKTDRNRSTFKAEHWQDYPRWLVVATLPQVAAGAYMLVQAKLSDA